MEFLPHVPSLFILSIFCMPSALSLQCWSDYCANSDFCIQECPSDQPSCVASYVPVPESGSNTNDSLLYRTADGQLVRRLYIACSPAGGGLCLDPVCNLQVSAGNIHTCCCQGYLCNSIPGITPSTPSTVPVPSGTPPPETPGYIACEGYNCTNADGTRAVDCFHGYLSCVSDPAPFQDRQVCQATYRKTSENLYELYRKGCQSASQLCDGRTECSVNTESGQSFVNCCCEGHLCNVNVTASNPTLFVGAQVDECAQLGCDHSCILHNGVPTCLCSAGYILGPDEKSCQDMNECANTSTNPCEDICVNTEGGYRCECNLGTRLAPDQHSCTETGLTCEFLSCSNRGCGERSLQYCDDTGGSELASYCQATFRLMEDGSLDPRLQSCYNTIDTCTDDECIPRPIPHSPELYFCCCTGHLCNDRIRFPNQTSITPSASINSDYIPVTMSHSHAVPFSSPVPLPSGLVPAPNVSMQVSGPLYTGTIVTITCSIHVNASVLSEITVEAVWRRGTTQLTNNSHTNISEAAVVGGSSLFQSNVSFYPIESSDSGQYTCEVTLISTASGNHLSTSSSEVTITVEAIEISVIVSGPLYVGNRGRLTCSIMANTSAPVLSGATIVTVWRKGVAQLTNNNRTNISEAFVDGSNTSFESNVTLSPIETSDNGDYTCEAILVSSVAGNVSAISGVHTLAIQAPNEPSELSGFAHGPTVITLTWLMDINIDHFVVEVNEIQTQQFWRFDTVNTHFNITSLHPYYLYECRVAAVAVVCGPFSTPVQVRTEEDAPSSPPANLTVTAITAQSASLSWDPVPFEHQNGLVRHYVIKLTSAGTTIHWTSNTTEATIQNLHPFTAYLISVSAETVGIGPYTDEIHVILPEDDPHAPPQNVQVVVTGSRTATVTWLPPPLEQQNGQIVYYILIITDSQLGSNSEINSTTTSFMATGLKEYNNYSCIVAAATTVGLGPYSLPVRFTTQQGDPSAPPQSSSGIAHGSTVVSLTWFAPVVFSPLLLFV